jgi:hypothetical protein
MNFEGKERARLQPRSLLYFLLARAAARILEIRLPLLHLAALWLGDDERTAAEIFGLIKLFLVFCHFQYAPLKLLDEFQSYPTRLRDLPRVDNEEAVRGLFPIDASAQAVLFRWAI